MKLSKEETELLKSVEDGEWETISDFKSKQKRYQAIAKNSLKKDERINIRLETKNQVILEPILSARSVYLIVSSPN